ncbi:hypothetical protein BCY91_14065 [Pelobium manganitolerans]|uniref:Uncharacterized protein n=1 Tax=Pelobium manganitolerans TaxID=1842495 RepID=A0A419SAA9_9SPHI|nr:hypothetical protein [Pelobium manganitolerans]RKD18998.1 hypothetical protein BCY91_14065 [Pelobium manganitolerans]
MDTETLTVLPKGEDFEIIVQHDQTGSAYGITLSKNAYEQLRQHFVVGRSEQLVCGNCKEIKRLNSHNKPCKCGVCGELHEAN